MDVSLTSPTGIPPFSNAALATSSGRRPGADEAIDLPLRSAGAEISLRTNSPCGTTSQLQPSSLTSAPREAATIVPPGPPSNESSSPASAALRPSVSVLSGTNSSLRPSFSAKSRLLAAKKIPASLLASMMPCFQTLPCADAGPVISAATHNPSTACPILKCMARSLEFLLRRAAANLGSTGPPHNRRLCRNAETAPIGAARPPPHPNARRLAQFKRPAGWHSLRPRRVRLPQPLPRRPFVSRRIRPHEPKPKIQAQRQRQGPYGRCRSGHAAALPVAQRRRMEQSPFRLRARAMRRLHRTQGRPADPLLHHADLVSRRRQDRHARRPRYAGD